MNVLRNVTIIGHGCFKKCTNLESVTFENGSELKKIGEEAFYETNINKITIPKSVKLIGKNCFKSYTDPKTIKIKDEPKSQKGV